MKSGFVSQSVLEERARIEQQPLVTRCSFCAWKFQGTVAEGRAASRKHRLQKHPEAVAVRRPGRRNLTSFHQRAPDQEELAEVERERQRRAKLNGIDIN